MAKTSKARRRTKRTQARKARPATPKVTRKRRKPARRSKAAKRLTRPPRAARRSARAAAPGARKAKRQARTAKRRARVARRPVKPARRPVRAAGRSAVAPRKATPKARPVSAARPKGPNPRPRTQARPPLDRARRVLADDERMDTGGGAALSEASEHLTSSAHAGHDALRAELRLHTESSPVLTAGDVDAKWQDAYAVGDESPGGDNPTPDQDRVDDIGRAMGIQYQDDQELMGGDEVLDRDKHRWELDPASSDDWPHKE